MKNVKLTKVISALALAAVMAVSSCGGGSSSSNPAGAAVTYATQKSQCSVEIDLNIAENIIMAKYNIDIYIDDDKMGTYSNGTGDHLTGTMEAGSHTLKCVKSGDSSVSGELTFRVSEDGQVFAFGIIAHTDYIEINKIS